ncbi:hypothetical protein AX16_005404 [Volvariella volvacea WC 439]|nr:hypothetical protein AX16_005404 [Volvariella volvacea WC 439]
MRSLLPLSLLLSVSTAVRIPFEVRVDNPSPRGLIRRAPATIPISNTGNAQYVGNITIGGVEVEVLLDTGSSDLWVHFPGPQPQATDMGKQVTLNYAIGRAAGHVHSARVEFANNTVDNQAFLLVSDTSTFTADIHAQGYDGLLGLGPNEASVIYDKVDGPAGDSLLTRIFEQDHHTSNYISFLLDRKGDPIDPFTGQLTISEIVPGFENITEMPKLDVDKVNRLLEADQHWQALTDKDHGVIGPDGEAVKVLSLVRKAPKGQFVAVFDSGFTFSQVPRQVSDAIYGRVKGAFYDVKNEWWTVPCGQYLNISFNFGGRNYPVHPLDTVDDNFNQFDANGNKVCIGAFQPITSAFSLLGNYDMIMGMSFLRNTYTLMDFGDWIDGGSNRGKPYIQIASVTDSEQAKREFIQTRLGGVDTTGDARWELLPKDQMQKSPISDEEKKKQYQEMILSRWPYIFIGCFLFIVLVIGCCIWKCCQRRRRRREQKANGKGAEAGVEMQAAGGSGSSVYPDHGTQSPYSSTANLVHPPPPYQAGHN